MEEHVQRSVLHHSKPSVGGSAALHLNGGEHRVAGWVGAEHAGGEEPGGSQVHEARHRREDRPLGRRGEVLPEAAHRRGPPCRGGGEVHGAELAGAAVSEAEPEAVLGDVLGAAAERQRPVAGLAPRLRRRVERIGATARRRRRRRRPPCTSRRREEDRPSYARGTFRAAAGGRGGASPRLRRGQTRGTRSTGHRGPGPYRARRGGPRRR